MRENELKIEINEHPLAMFAEREDGSYGSVETGSYMVENYFDDFWEKQVNFKNSALNRLKNGEVSPIFLYMEITNMTESDLASRVGLSTARVKKHTTPKGFEACKVNELKRYAEIFDIPLSDFFRIDLFASEDSNVKKNPIGDSGVVVIEREKNEQ